MQLNTVLFLELYKLTRKKTTYLLGLTLFIPLIFGAGMAAHISFLVTDGGDSFDIISAQGISALQFVANMLSQSTYIIYLIIIIIGSMSLANEMEVGQIRLYIVRIGERFKIIVSKVLSLCILSVVYMMVYSFFTIAVYYLFVAKSKYGNGKFFTNDGNSILYVLVTLIGIMVVIVLTVMMGMFFKTFHCFAVSYLVWFTAKYLSFFDKWKFLVPDNCADIILSSGIKEKQFFICMIIYGIYIVIGLGGTCYIFNHKDVK